MTKRHRKDEGASAASRLFPKHQEGGNSRETVGRLLTLAQKLFADGLYPESREVLRCLAPIAYRDAEEVRDKLFPWDAGQPL